MHEELTFSHWMYRYVWIRYYPMHERICDSERLEGGCQGETMQEAVQSCGVLLQVALENGTWEERHLIWTLVGGPADIVSIMITPRLRGNIDLLGKHRSTPKT